MRSTYKKRHDVIKSDYNYDNKVDVSENGKEIFDNGNGFEFQFSIYLGR